MVTLRDREVGVARGSIRRTAVFAVVARLIAVAIAVVIGAGTLGMAASDRPSDDGLEGMLAMSLKGSPTDYFVGVVALDDVSRCQAQAARTDAPEDSNGLAGTCVVTARVVATLASQSPDGKDRSSLSIVMGRGEDRSPQSGDRLLIVAKPSKDAAGVYAVSMMSDPTRQSVEKHVAALEKIAPGAVHRDAASELGSLPDEWAVTRDALTTEVLAKVGSCGHVSPVKSGGTPTVLELGRCGDSAVAIMKSIVEDGGFSIGVRGCHDDPDACRGWAIRIMGTMTGPVAHATVVEMIRTLKEPRLVCAATLALGCQRFRADDRDNPLFRSLLDHEDECVRSQAVWALGTRRSTDDFDRMLEITLALPPWHAARAATGLAMLGDPRAIKPLIWIDLSS